jgi:hypothetical protein
VIGWFKKKKRIERLCALFQGTAHKFSWGGSNNLQQPAVRLGGFLTEIRTRNFLITIRKHQHKSGFALWTDSVNQNYFRKADSLSTGQQIPRTLETLQFITVFQRPTIPFHPLLQRSRPISVFPFHCFRCSIWLRCEISFKYETIGRGLYGHCLTVCMDTVSLSHCLYGHSFTVSSFILASLLIDQML